MTSKHDDTPDSHSRAAERRLRPGIKMLAFSVIVATVSGLLFGYALDWSFAAGPDGVPPDVKRAPLALALIGFGASILIFLSGYMNLARK